MKTRTHIWTTTLLYCPLFCLAQTGTPRPTDQIGKEQLKPKTVQVGSADSEIQKRAEDKISELEKKVSMLNDALQKGDTVSFGRLKLSDAALNYRVPMYCKNTVVGYVRPISVELKIESFQIVKLYAYTDKGMFTSKIPIALIWYNETPHKKGRPRNNDKLVGTKVGLNYDCHLIVGDILEFEPSTAHRVSIGEYQIRLDEENRVWEIKDAPTANFIVNLTVFSDLMGLFGEPNGLVQFAGDAEIPIRYSNVRNKNSYWFRSIKLGLDLIRLDKEFQVVDARQRQIENRLGDSIGPQLFRQHYLKGNVDLNLFSTSKGTNYLNLYSGAEFRQGNVRLEDTITKKWNIISGYIGANFLSRALDNFRVLGDIKYYVVSHLIQTHDYEVGKFSWLTSSVTISYFPPSQPQSKIFLRYAYNFCMIPKAKGNDFSQVQIGYKTSLGSKVKKVQ